MSFNKLNQFRRTVKLCLDVIGLGFGIVFVFWFAFTLGLNFGLRLSRWTNDDKQPEAPSRARMGESIYSN